MAGILTVTGSDTGLLSGAKTIGPVNLTGTTTVGQITDVVLATGDNTLTVPVGATAVLIVLPSTQAASLHLRSNLNSSDTGFPFGPTGALLTSLASGVTSLILNASAGGAAIEATFI